MTHPASAHRWLPQFPRFDAELAAIATIYFVQGALGLSHLAVSFFLKDELGLGPAEMASLVGLAMVPWTIKPLYGFLSDGLPIFGYRRRPYLVASGILGTLAWLSMGLWVQTPLLATVAIAGGSLSIACSDAIIDALVVQRARQEAEGDAGSLQSFGWAWVSIGAIASSYLSGWLLERFGARVVFDLAAVLPLVVAIAAFAIADVPFPRDRGDRPSPLDSVKQQTRQLWLAVRDRRIWLPAAFVFVWQATPSSDSAFFYFTTNELGFNPEFLGFVRFATSLAGLAGVWVFQRYFRHVPIRRIFFWSTIASVLLGLTSLILVTHANRTLGISDRWFSLGDSLILTVAGRIAFMPVLVLAARLCPEGIEATLFALLMSVLNVAGLCSYQLGAALTWWLGVTESDFTHLVPLIVLANLSSLLPLPFLRWLPGDRAAGTFADPPLPSSKEDRAALPQPETIAEIEVVSR